MSNERKEKTERKKSVEEAKWTPDKSQIEVVKLEKPKKKNTKDSR